MNSQKDATETTEETLRQSVERFSKVFHASPAAITITAVADGRIVDVNDSFLTITGYSRDEVIGHTTLELQMWAEPRERAQIVQRLREHGSVRDIEAKFRTKTGEVHDALASLELIELGGEKCILTLMHDITERKRAEEALRESEEKYRDLVENINDIIFTVDADGVITYISPIIELLSGYSQVEVIGRPFGEFVYPEDLPGLMASFQRTLSGHLEPYEFRVLSKPGQIRRIHSSGRPIFEIEARTQGGEHAQETT